MANNSKVAALVKEIARRFPDRPGGEQALDVVSDSDVLIASWNDESAPNGTAAMIAKGESLVLEAAKQRNGVNPRWGFIHCESIEEAARLRDLINAH
jgi:hypothetical protein